MGIWQALFLPKTRKQLIAENKSLNKQIVILKEHIKEIAIKVNKFLIEREEYQQIIREKQAEIDRMKIKCGQMAMENIKRNAKQKRKRGVRKSWKN